MNSSKCLLHGLTALLFTLSSQVFAFETQQVSQAQLMSLLAAPKAPEFIVLDVRSQEEFAQGHITGAVNISHDTLAEKMTKISRYKDAKVIVHCRSGRRAAIAESLLIEQGFTGVRHLSGDIKGWQQAGLPLVRTP
ncbi:rhodanese-like domain-containing protein [Thalassomonas sp. RHCl1]|uniref:rhodanese-like domain-containing protein n=1 Tax=Thalassomonas sp. RHCl1 TaxID=2995320 RepID=UPI00248BB349|nr:rhodanese-like domain-containing protein [Thalassomonas sp. RHCl1]